MQSGSGQLGRVSPEERQRKTLQLLAKHAAEWELQARQFEQNSKVVTKKPHKSVMFMDHEWRERQRRLARAEQDQRRDQTMSWEHSLRFNEKLVELRLGRINPIVSVRSQADTDYALQAVLNMPEYTPVDQRIPNDLLRAKTERVESLLRDQLQTGADAYEERIDLPLGFELAPTEPPPSTVEQRPTSAKTMASSMSTVSRATKKLSFPTDKRQAVSTTVLDNFVAMIERQQDILQENQVVAGLRSNLINTQAFEEPYIFADECPTPEVSISAVNLTFIEAYPAELRISNTGDYLMQIELKSKDLKAAKIQVQHGGRTQEHNHGRPINGNLDSPISRTTYVSKYGTSSKQLTTLSLLKGKTTTYGQIKHRGENDSSRPNSRGSGLFSIQGEDHKGRHRSRRSSIVPGVQVSGGPAGGSQQLSGIEYQMKILEKAQTPSHLKVLADRFGRLENKKLLLNSYNNKIDIPCGESIVIKFFMPTRVNDRAGTISQEYELVISPPANCIIESGQMCTIKHGTESSVVPIVCTGVNTNALGVYKELCSYAAKGDQRVQFIASAQKCRQMLWELADLAVDQVEAGRQQTILDKKEEAERAKAIQKAVLEAYQDGALRCLWVADYTERKAVLYALQERLLGRWVKCQDLVRMQREIIVDFTGTPYEIVNFEYGERDIFYNLTPFQYIVNQSEAQILLQAHNSIVLSNHYKLGSYDSLNDYQRNLLKMVNKRIIGGQNDQHARFMLDSAKTTEQRVLQIATTTSPTAVISYHEMTQNQLSQKLLNIVLQVALQFICRQLKIGNQTSRLEQFQGGVNELIAPFHLGYDGRLLTLLYFAGACTVLEPVFDCLGVNRYGPLRLPQARAVACLAFLLDLIAGRIEESPIDEAGVEFLKDHFNATPYIDVEKPLREVVTQCDYEEWVGLLKCVMEVEQRSGIDAEKLKIMVLRAKQLREQLARQDKTLQARRFIADLYLLENVEVDPAALSGVDSTSYLEWVTCGVKWNENSLDEIKGSGKCYKWLIDDLKSFQVALEESKAKNTKKPPAKDAGKTAQKAEKQPEVAETSQEVQVEAESLQELYKKLLNAQRPESGQKAAKQQKPPPKTLKAVTQFQGRKFAEKSARDVFQTLLGADRPRLSVQETLVEIAMLAVKLQALPEHQILNQIVLPQKRADLPELEQARLAAIEQAKSDAEVEKIRAAIVQTQELSQSQANQQNQPGKDRKGAKTPAKGGKGSAVPEETDDALEKAKSFRETFLAPRPRRELSSILDLDAVLIQQRYIKELKGLVWLKEHKWLGSGAENASDATNLDFLLLNPEKPEKQDRERPRNSLHQLFSSSQILELPFDTENLSERHETELLNAFNQAQEIPDLHLQLSQSKPFGEERSGKKLKTAPIKEIQHQIRLKYFRKQFFHFVDSLFTEEVENACKAHYDSLVQYEDEMGVYERVQYVKAGQMRPEELGMTLQEVQAFPEPRKPQPADYFAEFIETQKEQDQRLNEKVRKFFRTNYDYESSQLLGFAAAKALKKLQQAALAQLRQVYDESTFKEVEKLINDAVQEKIDQLNNKPLKSLVINIFAMFDITLVFPVDEKESEVMEALGSVLEAPPAQLEQPEQKEEGEKEEKLEEAPLKPQDIGITVSSKYMPVQHFLANEDLINVQNDAARIANNELLLYIAGIRDAEEIKDFEALDFVDFDFHANYKVIEQIVQLPDPKKKADPKKPAETSAIPEVKHQDEGDQDEGEEEEEYDEEKMPGLYKPVEQDVAAQREVWAWLFTNALERGAVLCKFADDLEEDLERAYNYIATDLSELVQ